MRDLTRGHGARHMSQHAREIVMGDHHVRMMSAEPGHQTQRQQGITLSRAFMIE